MPLDDSLCAVIPDLQHPIRTVADALDRLDTLPVSLLSNDGPLC
jgi:hypothetical protein